MELIKLDHICLCYEENEQEETVSDSDKEDDEQPEKSKRITSEMIKKKIKHSLLATYSTQMEWYGLTMTERIPA